MSSNARKELRNLLRAIEDYHENAIEYVGKTITDVLGQHINAAYEALGEPLRNCDVGTAEEQTSRFRKYCAKQQPYEWSCANCPIFYIGTSKCEFVWAQMPYKKEGEE